jgi:imidazolonepropionase-like amidohydrolase
MSATRTVLAALLAAALPAAAQAPAPLVLHCGAYVDVVAGKRLGATSIVVDGDRVRSVEPGRVAPEGARIVDLPGHTCLPGLIDMHVHLTGQNSPKSYEEGFRLNPADYALRGAMYARRTLMAGFTSVRNLGDEANTSIALRNAIAAGHVPGPRIFSAGKTIATTGGHGDPTNGRSWEDSGDPGPKEGVVNSPLDARKAVRQRYKDGADVIKITATGGVLSYAKNGQNPQFELDEVEAIVRVAHDYGFKVAAHAHGDEGIRRAVLGGVDSIEHGTFMSADTIALMKEKGTWYVPTLMAGAFVAEKAKQPGWFPEIVRPKAQAIGPQIQQTLARAYAAGVRIAFGTDSGVSAHGDNAGEFALLVAAGMPPIEALRAATRNAAELLGESASLGTLEPGKYADVVAVPGDPLQDIAVMTKVDFVVKGGVVVRNGAVPAP